MPISVVCDQCGKAYAADEKLAGRRVRCRGCGHIVTIPREDTGGDDTPNIDALAEMERSFAGDTAMATRVGTVADRDVPEPQVPRMPGAVESVPLDGESIENAGRANLRFNFAGAKELDMALPWILVGGSTMWLFVQAARSEPTGAAWTSFTGSLFWLGAYALLVWPVVFAMLRLAGKNVGFQLPRTARWRTFGCYLPALVLTATMWMLDMSGVQSVLIGMIGGLLVASFSVYVLFRLQPKELAPTAAYGAGGYAIGLLLAVLALTGLNRLGSAVVESTNSADTLMASPLGPGFEWTQARARRVEDANRNRVRTHRANTVDPNEGQKAPDAPVQTGPPPVSPKLAEEASAAAVAAVMAGFPTGPVIDAGPVVARPKSPLVADFVPASMFRQPADRYIFPVTASPFVAVMKRTGDDVSFTVWDSRTWTTVNNRAITFRATQGLEDYALSPDGARIARTSTFLNREVEVYSTANPTAKPDTIPMDSSAAVSLYGMLPGDRLLVTADSGGKILLDVFDLARKRRARQTALEVPIADGPDKGLHFSAGAKFAGVLCRDERGNAVIRFFAMLAERNVSSHQITVTALPSGWPTTPAGFAVSTDSERPEDTYAAVLYENAGGAIVYAYRQSSESKAGEYIDRAGRLPRRPMDFTGPALQWIGAGKSRYLLVYGRTVLDVFSGEIFGDIDAEGLIDAETVDPNTLLLLCKSDRHPVPVRMKLNLERPPTE